MEFKTNLKHILTELQYHKRDKQVILETAIQKRLDKSLQSYYQDLVESYEFLANCNSLRMAKRLNRTISLIVLSA